MFLLLAIYFIDGDLHYLVVKGISRRYFPCPEMLNFHVFTSVTLVEWNFSSSHMALKGLQKRECIGRFLFLLNTKRSGGEVFLNIKPVPFSGTVVSVLALIVCFLPSM